MSKFYVTTAIDYVNGKAHIGHAYEKVLSDVIVRHFRQRFDNVYFLTGTDEHGIKIQKTAREKNITPKELCDNNANDFKKSWKLLNINYDDFIRTTDESHEKRVQLIFEKLLKQGDIYKNKYKGLYCCGCEAFINPKDLIEEGGLKYCPIHQRPLEEVEEENYFFKLTKYKDRIIEWIKSHAEFILPQFRVSEVLNQLEKIEDISVSRSKLSVSWGIEVLSDPSQVIYVWIDALSNYITALGYDTKDNSELFDRYWSADLQVIGKDILKFHAIYWIAILMALDLKLPKTIFAHGWITIDETKMSKSLGNVISPENVLKMFELKEPDALRYFLATCASCGKDGNFSDEEFKEKVNADLANNMGNLLNRTLNMLIKYFDGDIKEEFIVENSDLIEEAKRCKVLVMKNFDSLQLSEAASEIMSLVDKANKYIAQNQPWSLAQNGQLEKCGQVLYVVLEVLRYVSILIYPYCPNIASKMAKQLRIKNIDRMKLEDIERLPIGSGRLVDNKGDIVPIFLRLDSEFATKEEKKK